MPFINPLMPTLGGRPYNPASLSVPAKPTLNPMAAALAGARPVVSQGQQSDALAKALLAEGNSGEPIHSPLELLGRLAQVGAGNYSENKFLNDQKQRQIDSYHSLADALAGGDGTDWASVLKTTNDPQIAQFAVQQLAKGPAEAKPPTVHTFYDEKTGQEVEKQWNSKTGTWDQVGGVKQTASPTGTTTDISNYEYYKKGGGTASFDEWLTKNRSGNSPESAFGNLYFDYGPDNTVRGAYALTNRGTIIRYTVGPDGKLQYAEESRVPNQGVPGAAGAASPSPSAPPAVSPPQSIGLTPPPTPAQPNGLPGTPPPATGGIRPPGSVKNVETPTGVIQTTPGGAPTGTFNKDVIGAAAQTEAGKTQAADLQAVNTTATKAVTQLTTLAQMRRLSQDPNFYSGAGGEVVLAGKKLLAALGGDPSIAASGENFAALSNKLIYDKLGTLGNQISNGDRAFIERTIPNLGMTQAGVASLLDIYDALARRDLEVAQVAQDYANAKGGGLRLDQNWPTFLAGWAQQHPLFADNAAPAGGPTSPPTAAASGPARVNNDDDYNKLKSGQHFVGPDGVERIKP